MVRNLKESTFNKTNNGLIIGSIYSVKRNTFLIFPLIFR